MQNNSPYYAIYGIVPIEQYYDLSSMLNGLNVHTVPCRNLAAIVSTNEVADFRRQDSKSIARALLDYQKTIENIIERGFKTIIPVKFGAHIKNETQVLHMLENGYDMVSEIMSKVHHHTEIDLVSTWPDFNRVLARVVKSPEVIKAREDVSQVTEEDQVRIGYLIKKEIDELNEQYRNKITERLKPLCEDIKQHTVMNDEMICDLALLMHEDQMDRLEKEIDSLDAEFHGELNFKVVGPLPCYSFYTLEAKKFYRNEIETAMNTLGLQDRTSLKNIKRAYQEKAMQYHPDANRGLPNNVAFSDISNAYQTMIDYCSAVTPTPGEDDFSIDPGMLTENRFFLKNTHYGKRTQ